jgi:hypothetical protein
MSLGGPIAKRARRRPSGRVPVNAMRPSVHVVELCLRDRQGSCGPLSRAWPLLCGTLVNAMRQYGRTQAPR